ncbi:MAG TPA: biotin/lipoyl-containing protein [Bryobacteraceae bacterium]|nr:biotin/lipoyl-containing protein [Bryobacteraceae bacterium]
MKRTGVSPLCAGGKSIARETNIDGRQGRLVIDGSHFRYEREGEVIEGEFSLELIGAGSASVLIGGRNFRVVLSKPGEATVNGRTLAVEVSDPRDRLSSQESAASHGSQQVRAPMPGKVVRVLAAVGDVVEEGRGLVVVEAMKMQNEMKSPQAGRVTEVRARAGAAVTAGEVLVVIE